MTKKKILFSGCSFTADSGFLKENQSKSHWPHLLGQHYRVDFDNNAVGGSSNNEIFDRVVGTTSGNSYDLVLVQWSEISRQWIYHSNQNVDDHTILMASHSPKGWLCNSNEIQQYAKLHYTYFNNPYTNLRKWLCQVITLAGYLDSTNQPYVFVKGFENYVSAFKNIKYAPETGFINLENSIKEFLDFDNRPDDYILHKIKEIQFLIDSAGKSNWLNFDSLSFNDAKTDLADDEMHPGIESNLELTKQLIAYCDSNDLLTHDQSIS